MQCNVIHVMQCMQCNVCMEVRPSVRNEVVSHFFFFFHFLNTKWQNLVEARFELRTSLKWKSECTDGRTEWSIFTSPLNGNINVKCQYVNNGWTDKFQLFRLVSVQSHTVSKSVLSVMDGPEPKKADGQNTNTQIRSEVIHSMARIKRDRWHNKINMPYY
jgi:hypothetical protein